jgi:hypothetical protein
VKVGQPYEDLVELIFRAIIDKRNSSVERNVMLDGADGPRQIDVLVRSSVGPIDLVTIIECKDYKKIIDVTTIDRGMGLRMRPTGSPRKMVNPAMAPSISSFVVGMTRLVR